MAAPPVTDPSDRLSKLPDDVLAHILSFLPAQEAVRTCVVSRTWRDAWKFTRRLLITAGRGSSVLEVRGFVDRLLRLRLDRLEGASLDECDIVFYIYYDDDDNAAPICSAVNRWIRRALECRVQTLRVRNEDNEEQGLQDYFVMSNRHLISRRLTRLELSGIWFECIDLNLDVCPALELLEIRSCSLSGLREITSPSLKRLVITRCESNINESQLLKICVPRLVSLWLEALHFRSPLLEKMPELVKANVQIGSFLDECSCDDRMACYHVMRAHHISESDIEELLDDAEEGSGDYAEENTTKCVVLDGLAQAKDLVLIGHSTYIFRRDLRWCPTFSKLKTLVLDECWCEPADCRALACILEHAPDLEKLTVLFSGKGEFDIVLEGRLDPTAKSATATQRLKTVKVKCHAIHEGVQNVLKFLSTLNICFNSE